MDPLTTCGTLPYWLPEPDQGDIRDRRRAAGPGPGAPDPDSRAGCRPTRRRGRPQLRRRPGPGSSSLLRTGPKQPVAHAVDARSDPDYPLEEMLSVVAPQWSESFPTDRPWSVPLALCWPQHGES